MRKYDEWNQLQGLRGKVTLKHLLFGEQQYGCDGFQVINNDEKIGIVVKGAELFVYKQKVVEFCISGNVYVVGDDMLEIAVIVNKL
ncbi:MAG: hypothetical protein UH850_14875 [Paludibacteraceae bacterium]|nr:hypothetical protein [Paludibacteraceae bacterium]